MSRFFQPKYIANSIRIKSKAGRLKSKFGKTPYEAFKEDVILSELADIPVQYNEKYESFAYFNLESARKYYKNKKSLIHDIMLALVEYNEMLEAQNFDSERLIDLALSIIKHTTYLDALPQLMVDVDFGKFDIKGKVYSGIIQAKAASFLLRVSRVTGDDKYMKWAEGLLLACLKLKRDGGICIQNEYVKSWSEEYNTKTPSMVLNGYLFVLIAMAEVLNFSQNYDLKLGFKYGVETLLSWLPFFQQDGDVLYSMYHWDLSNVHYMGVVDHQMNHLCALIDLDALNIFHQLVKDGYSTELFQSMIRKG